MHVHCSQNLVGWGYERHRGRLVPAGSQQPKLDTARNPESGSGPFVPRGAAQGM